VSTHVRQLAKAGISLVRLPETDHSGVRWIVACASEKRPTTIISVVGDSSLLGGPLVPEVIMWGSRSGGAIPHAP
jgi:hypothetical protein